MPRTAFALPLRSDRVEQWGPTAHELGSRRARDHRALLLDRGIYREQIWVQTGAGTRPWSVYVWDCDDPARATSRGRPGTEHERWIADRIFGDLHGVREHASAVRTAELVSGLTVRQGVAGAATSRVFELLPDQVDVLRTWARRVEAGDLLDAHRRFLADAGVHEEWMWLQPARPGVTSSPVAVVHWLCSDPTRPLRQLVEASTPYADHLLGTLCRATGCSPEELVAWSAPLVSSMHVRRSDASSAPHGRLARRMAHAMSAGDLDRVVSLLSPDAALRDGDHVVLGAEAVAARLRDVLVHADRPLELLDVLVGARHTLLLVGCPVTGEETGVLVQVADRAIVDLTVLPVSTAATLPASSHPHA